MIIFVWGKTDLLIALLFYDLLMFAVAGCWNGYRDFLNRDSRAASSSASVSGSSSGSKASSSTIKVHVMTSLTLSRRWSMGRLVCMERKRYLHATIDRATNNG